jgi:hypothetical protein
MTRSKIVMGVLLLCAMVLMVLPGCASGGADAPAPATPAAPPPPPPPPAIVGSWSLTIETPVGTQESTLIVTGTAELLEGKITSPQGEVALRDIAFDGGKVTFGMTIDAQGQQMELTFDGTLVGDDLTGAFQSPFGPAPVTGKRATS